MTCSNVPVKQCEQEKEKISELKQVLNEAQQDRQHKVEYNEIARKILVYPSRDDMEMYVWMPLKY